MSKPSRQNVQVNVTATDTQFAVDVNAQKKIKLNIFDAINKHKIDDVKKYVAAGGDVNVESKQGYTPLMLAIQNDWTAPEVKTLLDNMPNIDLQLYTYKTSLNNKDYGKPLDMAIKSNNVDLVNVILDYAGTITLSKETTGSFLSSLNPENEIFKCVAAHINSKNYGHLEHTAVNKLILSNVPESIDIIDSILSQANDISEKYKIDLLKRAALIAQNESIVDLLIDNKFVDDKSIAATMYTLANCDFEQMFSYILEKNINKQPVIDKLNEYQNSIAQYFKYMELLGFKDESDPGTIYISDVLDVHVSGDLNFTNNNSEYIDVTACNTEQCVQVGLNITQHSTPQVIEDIII